MFSGGYWNCLLRVNLTHRTLAVEPVDPGIYRLLLGGRGVAAKYYYDEIPARIEPLSSENKIIFFAGPLTGVPVPASTKFQLSTKSPETGHYVCSNSGGNVGPQLRFAGFDGLIVEGKANSPVYLWIENDKVEIRDADGFAGRTTSEVYKMLKAVHGSSAAVMCVGPAAEAGVKFCAIQVDGRSFGRGGAGTVMAGKNLKAIAVHGTKRVPIAAPDALQVASAEAMKHARTTKAGHHQYGTAQYTEVMNRLGCYPTRNFQTAVFEGIDGITATTLSEKYKVGTSACYHCPVGCAQRARVKDGEYAGVESDPEYETIGAFGGQCGVSDLNCIIAANYLCDELGLDTMSTGTIIAYAMELFERGLITPDDVGELALRFGNGPAMVKMIRLIAERREGFAELLGEGFRGLAAARPDTIKYMMAVKHMPFAAYEPRGFHGIGLAFGTSSRGACHNVGGWTIRDELLSGDYDRYAAVGKGELVKKIQDVRAYVDCLGICTVVRSSQGFTDSPKGKVLEMVTGVDLTPELMEIGERVYALERAILNREGIRRSDDYLPERMNDPLPEGPAVGHALIREMYETMLSEYYAARGWDREGRPTPERLARLGLTWVKQ